MKNVEKKKQIIVKAFNHSGNNTSGIIWIDENLTDNINVALNSLKDGYTDINSIALHDVFNVCWLNTESILLLNDEFDKEEQTTGEYPSLEKTDNEIQNLITNYKIEEEIQNCSLTIFNDRTLMFNSDTVDVNNSSIERYRTQRLSVDVIFNSKNGLDK